MSQDGQFSVGFDGTNMALFITAGAETIKVTFETFDQADKLGDTLKESAAKAREMAARGTRPAIFKG